MEPVSWCTVCTYLQINITFTVSYYVILCLNYLSLLMLGTLCTTPHLLFAVCMHAVKTAVALT